MALLQLPIKPFLEQQGFVLLDGGLATELEQRGHDLNHPLWSALLILEKPDEVCAVHRDYLDAGADCIISATYQASMAGFTRQGLSEEQAKALILTAIELACDARDEFLAGSSNSSARHRPLVAASIGPYGAYLADGSEFHGKYGVSTDTLRAFHESRWQLLAESKADLLAIETIPSYIEAQVMLELLESTANRHAWISFSCADGLHLNDGTPLRECVRLFNQCDQIVAVGVNCTAPQYIDSLIHQSRIGAPDKLVVVYPNSGETYDVERKCWHGKSEPLDFATAASQWHSLGARLLGGCCRTRPAHVSAIRRALVVSNERQSDIVER